MLAIVVQMNFSPFGKRRGGFLHGDERSARAYRSDGSRVILSAVVPGTRVRGPKQPAGFARNDNPVGSHYVFEIRNCAAHFFSKISTVARVFSQSRYIWQPVPISWKEMVKFSTGAEVLETVML